MKQSVEKIISHKPLILRNNWIHIGNYYELLEWISHGGSRESLLLFSR